MDSQLSRSEKKRRAKSIEQLVNELASLTDNEIISLPCEQGIQEEIRSAKNLKGGAKKRQLKYATKLLRDKPVEELYDFLAQKKGSLLKKNREFHELENFRNLLINWSSTTRSPNSRLLAYQRERHGSVMPIRSPIGLAF